MYTINDPMFALILRFVGRNSKVTFHDNEFMSEEFNRPVRLQLELLKPEMRLREEKITSTIVVFGGTRILEPEKARARVHELEGRLKKETGNEKLKRQILRAKRVVENSDISSMFWLTKLSIDKICN